jgi:hypothetical protein
MEECVERTWKLRPVAGSQHSAAEQQPTLNTNSAYFPFKAHERVCGKSLEAEAANTVLQANIQHSSQVQ